MPVPGISRTVFVLSLVSLCTDVSSEMVYPLVPLFLTVTLGAPATALGVIEGVAEATANVLKLVSGRVTDRDGRWRAWIFAGYGLSALAKPLLALATIWPLVLLARLVDRVGKGTRSTPRDALIAAASDPARRGQAFGFHRSMDTVGAVVGPLAGAGLLALFAQNPRPVFLVATIPAILGVALIGRVRTPARPQRTTSARPVRFTWRTAPRPYRLFLCIGVVFALGNSSDTFLILRAHALGLGTLATILAYALYNVVYAAVGWPAGAVSDRLGRRDLLVCGFLLFALVYGGLGLATGAAAVWPLFAIYGLYMALTEGATKAYITGLMALVSSVLAGVLWDHVAPAAPFLLGGVTALVAASAVLLLVPRRRTA